MQSQSVYEAEYEYLPSLFELGLIATVYTGRRLVSEDAL